LVLAGFAADTRARGWEEAGAVAAGEGASPLAHAAPDRSQKQARPRATRPARAPLAPPTERWAHDPSSGPPQSADPHSLSGMRRHLGPGKKPDRRRAGDGALVPPPGPGGEGLPASPRPHPPACAEALSSPAAATPSGEPEARPLAGRGGGSAAGSGTAPTPRASPMPGAWGQPAAAGRGAGAPSGPRGRIGTPPWRRARGRFGRRPKRRERVRDRHSRGGRPFLP